MQFYQDFWKLLVRDTAKRKKWQQKEWANREKKGREKEDVRICWLSMALIFYIMAHFSVLSFRYNMKVIDAWHLVLKNENLMQNEVCIMTLNCKNVTHTILPCTFTIQLHQVHCLPVHIMKINLFINFSIDEAIMFPVLVIDKVVLSKFIWHIHAANQIYVFIFCHLNNIFNVPKQQHKWQSLFYLHFHKNKNQIITVISVENIYDVWVLIRNVLEYAYNKNRGHKWFIINN